MKPHNVMLLLLALLCLLSSCVLAQDSSIYSKLYNLPHKVFSSISLKAQRIEHQLTNQTEKYLARLAKQEQRLKRKLWRKDSTAAKELFGDIRERYEKLQNIVTSNQVYNGRLDSMQTALHFLEQSKLINQSAAVFNSYNGLQGKLNQTEAIKKHLKERQQQLKQHLQKFGLAKEFKKFQKDVYYYRAQVDEYKKILDDPSKLEVKLLQLVNKIPAFKNFFNKHSHLAGLFRGSDNYGSITGLRGLQTRSSVQGILQQRIAAGGAGAQQIVQQNIADAQVQLQQLKQKINQLGNEGGAIDMPGFNPNNQRTRSFFKRLEFGTNIQTQKARYYFPATSDIGLSVGYKLNDKSIIGLGACYKLGLGKGWNNIKLTHQGVGLRTFVDWKLKGSFYISGGYEQNYNAAFNGIPQLKDVNAWQQSALLGISKKYSIGNKFKGNMQLLYDFLHTQQVPRTQPIQYRLGYIFK